MNFTLEIPSTPGLDGEPTTVHLRRRPDIPRGCSRPASFRGATWAVSIEIMVRLMLAHIGVEPRVVLAQVVQAMRHGRAPGPGVYALGAAEPSASGMAAELRAPQLVRRGRRSPSKVLLDGEEQRQHHAIVRKRNGAAEQGREADANGGHENDEHGGPGSCLPLHSAHLHWR